jgi:hypothetical protein
MVFMEALMALDPLVIVSALVTLPRQAPHRLTQPVVIALFPLLTKRAYLLSYPAVLLSTPAVPKIIVLVLALMICGKISHVKSLG